MTPNLDWFSAAEILQIQNHLQLKTFELLLFDGDLQKSTEFSVFAKNQKFSFQSKSHAPGLAGFIQTQDRLLGLGFDIEKTERVTAEVAARICQNPKEFSQAPSPASLWTAKEATYKALRGPAQPQTVSQVCLENWQKHDSQFETYNFHPLGAQFKRENKGLVIHKKFYTFSFFSILP